METIGDILSSEPMVNGLFLIVGALIATVSSSVTGRKGREAEDRRSWYDKTSALYLEMIGPMSVFSDNPGLVDGDHHHFRQLHDDMEIALNNFKSSMVELELIGSKATLKAAKQCVTKAEAIAAKADSALNPSAEEKQAYTKATDAFLSSVRRDLNIKKPLMSIS